MRPTASQTELKIRLHCEHSASRFFVLELTIMKKLLGILVLGSPFSLEEKQALLETISINKRKKELEKILNTYVVDEFNNKTIQ